MGYFNSPGLNTTVKELLFLVWASLFSSDGPLWASPWPNCPSSSTSRAVSSSDEKPPLTPGTPPPWNGRHPHRPCLTAISKPYPRSIAGPTNTACPDTMWTSRHRTWMPPRSAICPLFIESRTISTTLKFDGLKYLPATQGR